MRKDAKTNFQLKWWNQLSDFRLNFNMFFLLLDILEQQRGYLWTVSPP